MRLFKPIKSSRAKKVALQLINSPRSPSHGLSENAAVAGRIILIDASTQIRILQVLSEIKSSYMKKNLVYSSRDPGNGTTLSILPPEFAHLPVHHVFAS